MNKHRWFYPAVVLTLLAMLWPLPGAVGAQDLVQLSPSDIPSDLIVFDNLTSTSPDGQHVVYVTAKNLGMADSTIWIADQVGTNAKPLVHGGDDFWVTNPIWSPNGQQIAYLKVIDSAQTQYAVSSRFEIWTVNLDGMGHDLLVEGSHLNPALGYGGETNIVWNADGEIEFDDYSVIPTRRYAFDVRAKTIREITTALPLRSVGQPSDVPLFKQCNPAWKSDQLGTCNLTICSAGCAITSVSMVFKYFGADINPGMFNTWLKNHGGYASGCLIKWTTAANYDPDISFVARIWHTDWDRLNSELDAGYPVVAEVKNGGHYVVVTHREGNTYYINDPGRNSHTLADYGNTHSGLIIYHGPLGNTDHTPPYTNIALNELIPGQWHDWFTTAVNVHLYADDQDSSVREIHYQLDNGNWQTRSGNDVRFTVSSDGNHTLRYYAVDDAGNQENTHTATFRIDATPPSAPGPISESHGVASGVWQSAVNDPAFSWSPASDATSGILYYRVRWKNTMDHLANTAYAPSSVRSGSYLLSVQAVDRAGNIGPAATFTFNFDGTPPHAPDIQNLDGVAGGVWQNQVRTPNFSWPTPPDDGSGIVGYYLYWGPDENGTSETLITDQSFSSGTPICDADDAATYYLRLRSEDGVGLRSEWVSFAFRYDGAPPTADLTANYGQEIAHQTRIHLDTAATDLGGGVSAMRLSNEGYVWTDWLDYAEEMTWEIPGVGRRWYTIYFQVQDRAGNVSEVVSDTVYLDVNAPRPRSENYDLWDDTLAAGGRTITSTTYLLDATVGQGYDGPSSVGQQYQLVSGFQAGAQAAPTTVPTATQEYTQIGAVIAAGGTGDAPLQSASYALHGTLGQPSRTPQVSSASYVATLGYWGGVAADVNPGTPPPPPPPPPLDCEFFSLSINNGALFTNRPLVNLNLCGPNATEMQLSNDGGFGGAVWQPYTRTISWTLTTYGDYVLPRYVYARFQDDGGDIHGTFFDDIIYDPHAPTGQVAFDPTDLLPDAQRLSGAAGLRTVQGEQAELFISAQDDSSGLGQVQVSFSPDFAGAEWQTFSSILPITFTAEGEQTVYVRFRDQAGNESAAAAASLIVDHSPPEAEVAVREGIVGPDVVSVTLAVTATDAVGAVAAMRVGTTPALTDSIWVTYTLETPLYVAYTGQSERTVYVQVRDDAGNESAVYEASYQVDVTPPWGTVEVVARSETTATLHFQMEDDLSGVATVLLSPDEWFYENVTELPYQEWLEWEFGQAEAVYIVFVDGVGNWSEMYQVTREASPGYEIYLPLVVRQFGGQ